MVDLPVAGFGLHQTILKVVVRYKGDLFKPPVDDHKNRTHL